MSAKPAPSPLANVPRTCEHCLYCGCWIIRGSQNHICVRTSGQIKTIEAETCARWAWNGIMMLALIEAPAVQLELF